MTVKEVADDAYFQLKDMNLPRDPDFGRLVRLTLLAENDFAQKTGCQIEEITANIVSGETDIDLAATGPADICRIWSVKYNGSPMNRTSLAKLNSYPAQFSFKDYAELVSNETIRLAFTPSASVEDGVTALVGVIPNTSINGATSNLTLSAQYQSALLLYVLWKFLQGKKDSEAKDFQREYGEIVGRTKAKMEEKYYLGS